MACQQNCKCHPTTAIQSLNEMDFERGIWYAAQYGDLQKVKYLLSKGIQSDQRDSAGYTALHYAARNGHVAICKVLADNGADINARTNGGVTALSRASASGAKDVTEFLLSKKADPFIQDSDGKTALHRAAENSHRNICQQLLEHAPSLVDTVDNKGIRAGNLVKELKIDESTN